MRDQAVYPYSDSVDDDKGNCLPYTQIQMQGLCQWYMLCPAITYRANGEMFLTISQKGVSIPEKIKQWMLMWKERGKAAGYGAREEMDSHDFRMMLRQDSDRIDRI
jgi:hypothetical protein